MAYSELLSEFHGKKVEEMGDSWGSSWRGPNVAYRLREDYDDSHPVVDRLSELLEQPECDKLECLIIGAWTGVCEGGGSQDVVAALAAAGPKLTGLRHLFFGEMTYEECEISWIQQTDLSPLLVAFPMLESLRVRGGSGLSFSKVRHPQLKELAIEAGGISRSTLRELFQCEFPNLEHLELLLGEENYGFDGGVEDLQPLFAGKLFPKLKFLGLMNSTVSNEIAAVLVNSPLANRLETIDLSMGTLEDEGVRSLAGLAGQKNLKRVNISHHFASEEAVKALAAALPCELIADDPQEADEDFRPVLHAE